MRKLVWTLCAAAAAWAQTATLTREGGDWVETTAGTILAPETEQLRVETLGSVTVRGDGGGQTSYTVRKRVRARSEAEARALLATCEFRVRRLGPVVRLSLRAARRGWVAAEMDVHAPASARQVYVETGGGTVTADEIGGSLAVWSGGGNIRLGHIGGWVRAETNGGEIVVEDAGGDVEAATGGGSVEVGRARGGVRARTNGGAIRVREAGGLVVAENGSGGIRLRGVSGELRAATNLGSILAELVAGRLAADSYLSTAGGDITVVIPSNLAVTVEAMNESAGRRGAILSEFSEIRVEPGGARNPHRVTAIGTLNGGGAVLRIATSDGTIFLRRRKE